MKQVRIAIIILILIVTHTLAYMSGVQTSVSRAEQAFDHSVCQYPDRLSNPPNGCDNTDPARPECMKIGIEDCDLPTQEPEPVIQPETPVRDCE